MSIAFDRAVSYYDETRRLPVTIMDLIIEALVSETRLQPGAQVLEIGIGSGRIAIPLAAKIGRISGVDLSLEMMALAQAKAAGTPTNLDLARADALQLPFSGGCFDLVYGVHVLHLISGWQIAVGEARRVLRPRGYFLASWHRRAPHSPNVLMRQELHRLVEERGVKAGRPGAQSEAEILEELENWHSELTVVNVADWTEPCTPAQIIEELDRQIYSETWMIPRPVLDEAIPLLRVWAAAEFGTLDREIDSPYNFRWLIARKP
jgi:ubiquinone/menaquinone biosynthesis C-methylase UbiE